MSDFDQMAPAALALAGVPFGEGDLEVLRAVAQAFEPAMRALDAVDLAELLAPWGEESRLLDAAQRIEDATDRRWVNAAPALA